MKKITSLLTLLLMFVCTSAFAQDYDPELTAITIGNPVEEFTTDTWYLLYQRRGGDGYAHYENATTRFYKRAVTFGGDPLTDGMTIKQAEKWLVRFNATENEGAYTIQFANGAYWSAAGTSNSSAINPTENKYDATSWAIYRVNGDGVDGAGRPVFGINIGSTAGARLDNNGNGGTLSIWDSGELTDVESNAAWSIVEVGFETISERDAAMAELQAVYGTYSAYTFEAGTTPGKYGEAEVAAFEAALDAASVADGPSGASLTAEDLAKMAQDIKETYDAVVKSRVPYATTITPGYYYIKSALDFKTTTTTEPGEDPETGEEIPGETIEVHHTKAMYTNGANGKWAELDETSRQDANFIWKITEAGDKKYHLISAQTEAQFNAITTSSNITLSAQSDSLVVFDMSGIDDVYNIRLASQAERDYLYIHCGGHGGGAGVQGNLVGWCNTVDADAGTANASEWVLEAIDEAIALAIIDACSPAKQIKAMTDSAAVILAAVPQSIAIAQDKVTEINEEVKLVSEFTSPCDHNTLNDGKDGQGLEALTDGNNATFWHSAWGNVPQYNHYVVAEADLSVGSYAVAYTRRNNTSDQLTQMLVCGTNEYDEENPASAEWTTIATLNFPYGAAGESLVSEVFDCGANYKYVKLELAAKATSSGNYFWHAAELQIYPASVSTPYATTQAAQRESLISALEKAIEGWNGVAADASVDTYTAAFNTLTNAYAAWQAVFVDPAALRQAIKNAPDTKVIKIGNNPGEWANAEGTIANLLASAQAYDESGLYTPAQSEKFINDLTKAQEDMFGAANKIKTGKWYNIRFATEAEYDEAGWNKNPAKEIVNEDANVETSHALFGKYITVVKHANETVSYTNAEGNEQKDIQYNVEELTSEDATFGAGVGFMAKQDIKEADAALWQFVAIGDSAYVLQNKATGLYMRTGTTGAVVMSIQPTTFNTSAIGYGKNLIKAVALTGANNNYLHAERATNNLVTWNATAIESNSALYIEEVADVTEQPACDFTMSMWPGRVQTMCYPAALTAKDGTFYEVEVEGTTVTLNPIKGNTVGAGQPVVYIYGDPEDYEEPVYDEESENYNADNFELVSFTHGTEFVNEAGTMGALVGSFVNKNIGSGNMWASKNSFEITKSSNNTLGANTAYIEAGIAMSDLESEVTLVISNKEVDAIETVIATVNKSGNIYTVDGKLAGKGNINALKSMPKGIYIVNGVKVTVK